jgi:hypothetical protein
MKKDIFQLARNIHDEISKKEHLEAFLNKLSINLCVRKTPPKIGPDCLISVLSNHKILQINAFIFSKNLHNPEVPGSNPGLATVLFLRII